MPFDILGYQKKFKDFYGDTPLEDVARSAYDVSFAAENPDYNAWKQSAGIEPIIQEDIKRRTPPTFMDKLREGVSHVAPAVEEQAAIPGDIPSRSLYDFGKDTAIDLTKGAVGLGESGVGIGDIVTGNFLGKGMAKIGYDPKATKEILSSGYSPARQAANKTVEEAKGFIDTTMAYVTNPSAAVGAALESTPGSIAIGGVVRSAALKMLATAGVKGGTAAATAFLERPEVIAKLSALSGAVEGAQSTGSIQEQGRQEGRDWQQTVLPAIAAGIGTGLISILSSKLLPDIEVKAALTGMKAGKLTPIEYGKNLAKAMFKEGALEEMPQSGQEQIFTNLAMGKPWSEGVAESMGQGLIVGALQSGGMSSASDAMDAIKQRGIDSEITPEAAAYMDKMKKGAVYNSAIDTGLSTGKVGETAFTPDHALEIIKRGQNEGIYGEADIDRFKSNYPQLRDGLNEIIVGSVLGKVNETVSKASITPAAAEVKPTVKRSGPLGAEVLQTVEDAVLSGKDAQGNVYTIDNAQAALDEYTNKPNANLKSAKQFMSLVNTLRKAGTTEGDVPDNIAVPVENTKAQDLPADEYLARFTDDQLKVMAMSQVAGSEAEIERRASAAREALASNDLEQISPAPLSVTSGTPGTIADDAKSGGSLFKGNLAGIEPYAFNDSMKWENKDNRIEYELNAPGIAANPGPNYEAGIRHKGWAQEAKKFNNKEAAIKWLEDYDTSKINKDSWGPGEQFFREMFGDNFDEEVKSKITDDNETIVKQAILDAKKNGPSPEFRSLFGGIDPAVAGTTAEKVKALAGKLGLTWRETEAPTQERQPWTMTRDKFVAGQPIDKTKYQTKEHWSGYHKSQVRVALKQGITVTPEVLADYPDLKPTQGKTTADERTKILQAAVDKGDIDSFTADGVQIGDAFIPDARFKPLKAAIPAKEATIPQKAKAAAPVKSPYGRSGIAAFKKMADVAGLQDPDTGDHKDLVSFFEKYYNAGLEGRQIPRPEIHPDDAHAAYRAGDKDRYAADAKKSPATVAAKPLVGEYNGDPNETNENPTYSEETFKKDLKRFAGELKSILGYEADITTKGKKSRDTSVTTNIAPAGGDGTIILWKPGTEYGVYISVPAQREYGANGLTVKGLIPHGDIMFRATTKAKKFTGFPNQWAAAAITPEELATRARTEVDFYEQKAAQDIIKEAQDAGLTESEIKKALRQGEKAGETEGATKPVAEVKAEVTELAAELGVDVSQFVAPDIPLSEAIRDRVLEKVKVYIEGTPDEDHRLILIARYVKKAIGEITVERLAVAKGLSQKEVEYLNKIDADNFAQSVLTYMKRHGMIGLVKAAKMETGGLTIGMLERAVKSGDARGDALTAVKGAIEDLKRGDIEGARLLAAKAQGFTGFDLGFGDTIKKPAAPAFGSTNTTFTGDKAAEARARIKAKLAGIHAGVPLDPEMMTDGAYLAGYYIEGGARSFVDYSKKMIADFGDKIRPFLKSFYMAIKYHPGFDTAGMNTPAEMEAIDENTIDITAKEGKFDSGGSENEHPANGGTGTGALEENQSGNLSTDGGGRSPGEGERGSGQADTNGNENPDAGEDDGTGSLAAKPGVIHIPDGEADGEGLSTGTGRSDGEGSTVEDQATPASEPRSLQLTGDNPGNYRITEDDHIGSGTRGQKIDRNLAAIRLVKQLEKEGRYPTKEEQSTLAKYVGWGGIKNVLDATSTKPQDVRALTEIKQLLTESEFLEAFKSITNAHYTSPEIISSIYDVLRHMGYEGGNVLEATYGVGNFIGLMPEDMAASSKWYGSELDPTTAKIGQFLYPDSQLIESGFQVAEFPFGKFDLAIGNPPFGGIRIADVKKSRSAINRFKIHNYVIAKEAMHLKPGGILANVVTTRFLDTPDPEARDYLANNFKFLGAIRLPNDAFSANAGTTVSTDIVFLQRLMPDEKGDINADWLTTGATMTNAAGETITLNKYFANNPHMMLGEPSMKGTMYGGAWKEGGKEEFTLNKRDGDDMAALVQNIINNHMADLKDITNERAGDKADAAAISLTINKEDVSVGGFYEDGNGDIYMRGDDDNYSNPTFEKVTAKTLWSTNLIPDEQGGFTHTFTKDKKKVTKHYRNEAAVPNTLRLGETKFGRIKGMLNLRSQAYKLIEGERFDLDGIEALRTNLNKDYDAFVKEYGFLSENANFGLMSDDIKIEFGLESGFKKEITPARAKALGIPPMPATAVKASLLTGRVFFPAKEIIFAKDVTDGYGISLSQRGRLDIQYIAQLTGKTVDEVTSELSDLDLIYEDPTTKEWIQEDAYLSGNVKAKHKIAMEAGMGKNATALEKVFPEDVGAEDVYAGIGATWIPEEVYTAFGEFIGISGPRLMISHETGKVFMSGGFAQNDVNVSWVNGDYAMAEMFNAAAGHKTLIAYDGSGDDRTVNKDRTKALATIVKQIKNTFNDWLMADDARSKVIVKKYNDSQNTHAERILDGTHLKMVGASPAIVLRNTQRNAAWRMVQSPIVLLDHAVGAGKTFTIITGIMERVRMGLTKKAIIAVPNHLVGQWAADWMKLYPGAKILAATNKDFTKQNRRRLFSRITTGNYDAVIVGHSSFGFIPIEAASFQSVINEEIQHLMRAHADAVKAGEKKMASNLAKRIQAKQERLTELMNKPRDNVSHFEQMGIDHIVVDESHEFKNLEYSSAMQNVTGMGNPTGSKRAFDLYAKIRWITAQKNTGITFATGTPISNSLVEMYAILRYLNRQGLVDRRLEAFDSWASAYATTENRIEYTASQKLKDRVIMSTFNNIPELLQLYNEFADSITMADLKKSYAEQIRESNRLTGAQESEEFPIPKVDHGGRQLELGERDEAQGKFNDYLVARATRLEVLGRANDPKIDNHLWLMGDARKMALDIRLVDPTAKPGKNNKINRAANKIKAIYDKWDHVKGTQLVFCDLSTPAKFAHKEAKDFIKTATKVAKLDKDAETQRALDGMSTYKEKWLYLRHAIEMEIEAISDSREAETAAYMARRERLETFLNEDATDSDLAPLTTADTGFSVYDDLKATLIRQGIPAGEIRFIHEATTADKKTEMFGLVNAGAVRVLIGSTPMMGAGTNAQERMVALHHMDAPWRPSDVEQREGRLVRQGNSLYYKDPNGFLVEIYAYSTSMTFDAVMWQILARKQDMLDDFRSGRRSLNDGSGDNASYADFMAETTGNPAFREKFKLEGEIEELGATMRRIATRRRSAEQSIKYNERIREERRNSIEIDTGVLEKLKDLSNDFSYLGTEYKNDIKEVEAEERGRLKEINDAAAAEHKPIKADILDKVDDKFPGTISDGYGGKKRNTKDQALAEDYYQELLKAAGIKTQPKFANFDRDKLVKKTPKGATAGAMAILKAVNNLPKEDGGEVSFNYGDVKLTIKASPHGYTKEEEKALALQDFKFFVDGIYIDGIFGQSANLAWHNFEPFLTTDNIRRHVAGSIRDSQSRIDSMDSQDKGSTQTLDKLQFNDSLLLAQKQQRYADVVVEVNALEAEMDAKRATEPNKYIDQDTTRFGSNYDPNQQRRDAAQAQAPPTDEGAKLDAVPEGLTMTWLREDANRNFDKYRTDLGDPESPILDNLQAEYSVELARAVKSQAILAQYGEFDLKKAAQNLRLAKDAWDAGEEYAAGEDDGYEVQGYAPEIIEAEKAIKAIRSGQGKLFDHISYEPLALYEATLDKNGNYDLDKAKAKGLVNDRLEEDIKQYGERAVSTSPKRQRVVEPRGTIGSSVPKTLLANGFVSLAGTEIKTHGDLAAAAQIFRDPRIETLRIFYLKDGEIVGHEGLSSRMPGFSAFYNKEEQPKELWKISSRMRRLGADQIYLLHNHPSGRPKPSESDLGLTHWLTKTLAEKSQQYLNKTVPLVSHVIINHSTYAVITPELDYTIHDLPHGATNTYDSEGRPHDLLGKVIGNHDDIANMGKQLQIPKNHAVLFFRSSDGTAKAIQDVHIGMLKGKDAFSFLKGLARAFGSPQIILYMNDASQIRAARIKELIEGGGLLDVITPAVFFNDRYRNTDKTVFGEPMTSYGPKRVNEDAAKYEAKEQTDPPGKDAEPGKVKAWIQDETDAILQTAASYLPKNMPAMGFMEKLLKSPEYYDHPALNRIVRLFARDRSEIYHELLNKLLRLDDPNMAADTVNELAQTLKVKGLSLKQRITGETSKEYKDLMRVIDDADTTWKRDTSRPLATQIKMYEDHIRKEGASTEVIKIWKFYRESYDRALDLMTAQMREMIEQISEEAAFKGVTPANYSDMFMTLKGALATMETWKGFYAPRQRAGNWVVSATRERMDGTIETYREHKWSQYQGRKLALQMQRNGWTVKEVTELARLPEDVYQDVKTASLAKTIDHALDKMKSGKLGAEMAEQSVRLNEEVLHQVADMIKARGFRSTMIHRNVGDNVTRGYQEDPIERHVIYSNNVARGIAKSRVALAAYDQLLGTYEKGVRSGGIDAMKEGRVFTTAEEYIREQLRNLDATDRAIGWAKSLATLKFLGFNARSLTVNMTSMLTTVPTAIHQYAMGGSGSLLKVGRYIAVAGKDYAKFMAGKFEGTEQEMAFLNEEKRRGWDDPQYTRDAMEITGKVQNIAWNRIMNAAMYGFGKTEQWNRGATMLAAYRLAIKGGANHVDAMEMAKTTSDKAHGIYGRATMPSVAWGSNPAAKVAQMALTYTKFSHNYLQMLYETGIKKGNVKAAVYGLIAPIVLGGLAAVPFKDALILPILKVIAVGVGLMDWDEDLEKVFWKWTRELLGDRAEVAGRFGVMGAAGFDISGSLSIGVGVPKNFAEVLGAIGGIGKEIADAGKEAGAGNIGRAAEHLLPSGFANIARAIRENSEGVTSIGKKNRIWDEKGRPYKPDTSEMVRRAVGFRSSRQAALSERLWEGKRQAANFADKKSALYERYRVFQAQPKREPAEYRAIIEAGREFNKKIRELGLSREVPPVSMQAMRTQAQQMRQAPKRDRAMLE